MNVGFSHVLSAGIPPPLAFPGEALSMWEKVSIEVKVKGVVQVHLRRSCYELCTLLLSSEDGNG